MLALIESSRYYSTADFLNNLKAINIIFDFKFRIFKIRTFSDKFIQFWKINTAEELYGRMQRFAIKDIWMSVSSFLNPEKVGKKRYCFDRNYTNAENKTKKLLERMFLKSELLIDFDGRQYDHKSKQYFYYDAYDNLRKAVGFLQKRFSNFYYVQTNRGWQLHVLDFYDKYCPKSKQSCFPMQRENYVKFRKQKLLHRLRKKKIDFDYYTSVDNWRIIRLPFSCHSSGVICKGSFKLEDFPYPKNDATADEIDTHVIKKLESTVQPHSAEIMDVASHSANVRATTTADALKSMQDKASECALSLLHDDKHV